MAQIVKSPPAVQETGSNPCVRKMPWRREWLPISVFLPGERHGQRSLAGYIFGVAKSGISLSDEHLHFSHYLLITLTLTVTLYNDTTTPFYRWKKWEVDKWMTSQGQSRNTTRAWPLLSTMDRGLSAEWRQLWGGMWSQLGCIYSARLLVMPQYQ